MECKEKVEKAVTNAISCEALGAGHFEIYHWCQDIKSGRKGASIVVTYGRMGWATEHRCFPTESRHGMFEGRKDKSD
jgi:hypothetical protein